MAPKKSLLDLDDDDNDLKLEINRDYAHKYSTWRQKEELQKLKSKYGEEVGMSSSSSEEEDENAEALTGTVDKSWFRALAAVRSNDPRIYEKDVKFFDSDDPEAEDDSDSSSDASVSKPKSPKKKKKDDGPMYMKDFERKLITEKGGVLSESDDDEDKKAEKLRGPSYHEEQEAIRKSLKTAIADMSSGDEDEEILKQRVKTKREKAEEEEEYIQFLKGQKRKEDLKKDKDIAEDLAPLKELYSRPDLDEDDKLLWNIVLDQGFRIKNKAEDEDWYAEQMAELQADEEALEEQEQFENKYNFRFEEPDKEYVKAYERNPQETLRQKVNKRALKRQEVKERKKLEKERKQEEIRQLKNLKKKEILSKLDQLKEVTGNPTVGFSAKDIEEEFDPAAHDKMMQKYFGDEFYEEEELEKPQFEDDDDEFDEDEDWDAWAGSSGNQQEEGGEEHAGYSQAGPSHEAEADIDDPDFNMDADYDPSQASYTSGKKKKKSKFKQLIEKKKPTFEEVCKKYEGSDHPFGDYLDEYFKLDCEDIIGGDIKCRFRYRKTVPNDYGLTVEEILRCPEKELNAWASMKKIAQFRNEDDELYEVRKYKRAKMLRKKLNILPTLKEPCDVTEPEWTPEQQRKKGKKHRGDHEEGNSFEQSETEELANNNKPSISAPLSDAEPPPKKKKKKKRKAESLDEVGLADAAAPCRKKKKVKQTNESELLNRSLTNSNQNVKKDRQKSELKPKQPSPPAEDSNGEVKRKKKKKKKSLEEGESEPTASKTRQKQGKGKKMKRKMDSKPKGKGYLAGDMISNSRLLALGVDPRKFKYTKHRIMREPGDD